MFSFSVIGINKDATPLSEAFSLDLINHIIYVEKNINNINKVVFSTSYKYLESFNILNNYYTNILITIDIRVDYLCDLKNINYSIDKIEKIICICSGDKRCNKSAPIKLDIIDSNIIDINKNSINIYLLYLVSIDLD